MNNIKPITPQLAEIKNYTPALKIDDKYFVNGIGGNYIPGGPSNSMEFYKCASVQSPSEITYYTVSGAGNESSNGNYYDAGTTKNGKPLYFNSDTSYYIMYFNEHWVICNNLDIPDLYDAFYTTPSSEYPIGTWYAELSSNEPAPTVTKRNETIGNKTWTGYKAVLSSDVYTFESSVTSGLTYGSAFTPDIGKVYADGALVKTDLYTGIPQDGLVFYAPLGADSAMTETGQTLTKVGSGITFQTYKNVPSVRFTSSSYITVTDGLFAIPSGSSPFSLSAWCCLLNKANDYGSYSFGYGDVSISREVGIWFSGVYEGETNMLNIDLFGNQGFATGVNYNLDTWYHCCLTWDGTLLRSYINGIAKNTASKTVNTDTSAIMIGCRKNGYGTQYPWDGYVAAYRIYDRTLNTGEVAGLANEFTPT